MKSSPSQFNEMNNEEDYDLTCWYLNIRRVLELVGTSSLARHQYIRSFADVSKDMYASHSLLADAKDAIVDWIKANQPRTLGQLILSGAANPGAVFTHYSNFYCKGLRAFLGSRKPSILPEIYSKLDHLAPKTRLSIQYHPEHLTATSAASILAGQATLLVLAVITAVRKGLIEARPYAIATPLPELGKISLKGQHWSSRMEVSVERIDSFALARNEPRLQNSAPNLLKDIYEDEIKRAFAEIIGEPFVPKDWGGERSDLFSSFVMIEGRRISTAFAFKGRSKFKPMTMATLGKNGDQIDRLFSEPADLLVLQHCHVITPPVRAAMRAYATRINDLRLFALIDGFDTLRVLRAYQKCGLTPTVSASADRTGDEITLDDVERIRI